MELILTVERCHRVVGKLRHSVVAVGRDRKRATHNGRALDGEPSSHETWPKMTGGKDGWLAAAVRKTIKAVQEHVLAHLQFDLVG